ncbi:MAG: NfeD family protein [Clostridiales bacterium]|nr:NfeD family protein [Clostridiales bacterium]
MTVFGITLSAAVLWLTAAAVLAIIEAFTLGLTTIWFAGGAVGASIASLLGASVIVQVIVFLAISIILIVVTRPIVKKRLNNKTEKTNIDAIIGQEAIVEEDIFPHSNGQVRADGKVWTAASSKNEIKKGVVVIIKDVRGVTLIVEEKE